MKEKKTLIDRINSAGPPAVVTSAFIGPGTITTTTNAVWNSVMSYYGQLYSQDYH